MNLNNEFGMNVAKITDDALMPLIAYNWPGNVRECVSWAMIYMDPSKTVLELEDVMKFLSTTKKTEDDSVLDKKSTLSSIDG